MATAKLTAVQVKAAKPGDKLGDGGGLRLDVDGNGNRAWLFRFTSPAPGNERFMGLGPFPPVDLQDARASAANARASLRDKIDPIEHRKAQREAARIEASRTVTFRAYAERFISSHEAG